MFKILFKILSIDEKMFKLQLSPYLVPSTTKFLKIQNMLYFVTVKWCSQASLNFLNKIKKSCSASEISESDTKNSNNIFLSLSSFNFLPTSSFKFFSESFFISNKAKQL